MDSHAEDASKPTGLDNLTAASVEIKVVMVEWRNPASVARSNHVQLRKTCLGAFVFNGDVSIMLWVDIAH